jgi:hypothetical protein
MARNVALEILAADAADPVVIQHEHSSQFGETPLGEKSVADLQNVLTNSDTKMKGLAQAYADFSPTWVNRDRQAFVDWTNDWSALQSRYQAAADKANTAITLAKLTITPNSMIPAQAEYDGIAKALRQSYPPDGGPQTKGDYQDLYDRLSAARGANVAIAPMVQPTATDWQQAAYAATAPVDIVAQATGEEAPKLHLPTLPTGYLAGAEELLVGGGLVGGFLVGARVLGVALGGPLGALLGGVGAFVAAKRLGL